MIPFNEQPKDVQYVLARNLLMSGQRATPPRHSKVLAMRKQILARLPVTGRRIMRGGKLFHPTKGRRRA